MDYVRPDFLTIVEPHDGVQFRPETFAAVSGLQQRIRLELPEVLADILTTYGPLGFTGEASVSSDDGREYALLSIFDVRKIEKDFALHPDYEEAGYVPFADDEFNNRYVWQPTSGKVFFIDYEHGGCHVSQIASSFEEYLKRIHVTPYE